MGRPGYEDSVAGQVEKIVYDGEPESAETYEFMGFRVSAQAQFVGELIQHQTQLDLIIDQIRDLHRKKGTSGYCGCGVSWAGCRTWPIIAAYDRARERSKGA